MFHKIILLLFSLTIQAFLSRLRTLELIKVNETILFQWYNTKQVKIIQSNECHPNSHCEDEFHLFYHNSYGCCQNEMLLSSRDFNSVLKNQRIFDLEILLHVFMELSRLRLSLVMAGDSLGVQFHSALLLEMQRENMVLEVNHLKYIIVRNNHINPHEWNPLHQSEKIKLRLMELNIIHPVLIYNIWLSGSSAEMNSDIAAVHSINYLNNLNEYHDGIALLANIGLHLKELKAMSDKSELVSLINSLYIWLTDLKSMNPNSLIVFRESTPAHFEFIYNDGMYGHFYRLQSSVSG